VSLRAGGRVGKIRLVGGDQFERDQFERIERTAQIERAREIIAKYHEGIRYYQQQIEDNRYSLGRLDERLGG
jgi:hypothetical protein